MESRSRGSDIARGLGNLIPEHPLRLTKTLFGVSTLHYQHGLTHYTDHYGTTTRHCLRLTLHNMATIIIYR